MHCTPAAEGSSCNLTLPAAGLAVLQLGLPGAAADGSPPEPCAATFQTVLTPLLVLRCLLGVWLVLFAHRALATRPGQAALRLCNAAAQAAAPWKRQLRAAVATAAASAAAVAFIRAHIDDWPAEGRKLAAAGELVAFGIMAMAGLATLAIAALAARAARSVRPRPWHGGALAFAAPFLLQLLGAALVDSNSKELNWAARLAAFFAWLLLLRPRFLTNPAVSGSSLEQHRRDTGAASVTSPTAGWREQAEALQRQLLSGLEEVTSRRRRPKAA
ncbi:hypothetical protein COHA_005460 [Chlorella ohadii]|uniref:Uncharacterized protein n=1 Tax=Chlorella ohadii TaxID=2649997 RepID=A0AAD5H1N7_9CHLO|nr:hypothetical protein COHA_005460 [Chlorella ohadii]